MLKWITCYLSGKHDFQVACAPGAIFLRCNQCGRRSNGWSLIHDAALEPAAVRIPPAAAQRVTAATALR
jgi:hypothetical protein